MNILQNKIEAFKDVSIIKVTFGKSRFDLYFEKTQQKAL